MPKHQSGTGTMTTTTTWNNASQTKNIYGLIGIDIDNKMEVSNWKMQQIGQIGQMNSSLLRPSTSDQRWYAKLGKEVTIKDYVIQENQAASLRE